MTHKTCKVGALLNASKYYVSIRVFHSREAVK